MKYKQVKIFYSEIPFPTYYMKVVVFEDGFSSISVGPKGLTKEDKEKLELYLTKGERQLTDEECDILAATPYSVYIGELNDLVNEYNKSIIRERNAWYRYNLNFSKLDEEYIPCEEILSCIKQFEEQELINIDVFQIGEETIKNHKESGSLSLQAIIKCKNCETYSIVQHNKLICPVCSNVTANQVVAKGTPLVIKNIYKNQYSNASKKDAPIQTASNYINYCQRRYYLNRKKDIIEFLNVLYSNKEFDYIFTSGDGYIQFSPTFLDFIDRVKDTLPIGLDTYSIYEDDRYMAFMSLFKFVFEKINTPQKYIPFFYIKEEDKTFIDLNELLTFILESENGYKYIDYLTSGYYFDEFVKTFVDDLPFSKPGITALLYLKVKKLYVYYDDLNHRLINYGANFFYDLSKSVDDIETKKAFIDTVLFEPQFYELIPYKNIVNELENFSPKEGLMMNDYIAYVNYLINGKTIFSFNSITLQIDENDASFIQEGIFEFIKELYLNGMAESKQFNDFLTLIDTPIFKHIVRYASQVLEIFDEVDNNINLEDKLFEYYLRFNNHVSLKETIICFNQNNAKLHEFVSKLTNIKEYELFISNKHINRFLDYLNKDNPDWATPIKDNFNNIANMVKKGV